MALEVFDADPGGAAAIATMPGAALTAPQTDRLRILGNLATSDTYLVENTGSASANSILLQTSWQGFRRSFAADATGTTFDTALFSEVFATGRLLHIEHPRGFHFVTTIVSASLDSSGRTATVSISPPLPGLDECNFALCTGCLATPLVQAEYALAPAPTALVPRDVEVTGANTVLVRREVPGATGTGVIAGSERVVLEYAVDFDVTVAVDTAGIGAPPVITWLASGAAVAQPARIRAARVSIAGRTQEIDPEFPVPWTGTRTASDPLSAFTPFSDRPGVARVRQSVAEILLPNVAYRGL